MVETGRLVKMVCDAMDPFDWNARNCKCLYFEDYEDILTFVNLVLRWGRKRQTVGRSIM